MIKNLFMRWLVRTGKRADKYRAILAASCLMAMCGCATIGETWMRSYVAVHDAADVVLSKDAQPAPLPAGQAPVLWDAYYCAGWAGHNDQANLDRAAGIQAAKAAGKTAISFKWKDDSGAFKIAVYHWPSNVDNHFQEYPENWTDRARVDAGVTRWVANIADCDLAAVVDTFKAYGSPEYQVQFTGVLIDKATMKILGCDGNGVKITPPVDR